MSKDAWDLTVLILVAGPLGLLPLTGLTTTLQDWLLHTQLLAPAADSSITITDRCGLDAPRLQILIGVLLLLAYHLLRRRMRQRFAATIAIRPHPADILDA